MAFKLPPNQQLTAPGRWPVVGEKQPREGRDSWTVSVTGEVGMPCTWSLDDLLAMPRVEETVDVHCVTRWSKPSMRFSGVPLERLIDACEPGERARYVSFVARSERNHSTSLPLADALSLGALVVFAAEGEPLTVEHGGPVRTVVPGRYFYKSLKWLERVELLAGDRLGYWEAESGYHNVADPLREERYAAANLDRRLVAEVLSRRDFRGLDLRSLVADDRDLEGLDARGSSLRDGGFRRARLRRARFDGANLSNAHLQGADLRQASFAGSDIEGADLRGADLRGADLRVLSLVGVTFCAVSVGGVSSSADETPDGARLDSTTRIDLAMLDQLAPLQAEFVADRIRS